MTAPEISLWGVAVIVWSIAVVVTASILMHLAGEATSLLERWSRLYHRQELYALRERARELHAVRWWIADHINLGLTHEQVKFRMHKHLTEKLDEITASISALEDE